MTTAKDVGSIILLVLLSPLALIALLLGAVFAIPIYIIGVILPLAGPVSYRTGTHGSKWHLGGRWSFG